MLRINLFQVGGNSDAGNSAESRADFLHSGHERETEQHSPKQGITEFRSGLGVGCDSTGVIIGCTRYQTGAQTHKKTG